MNIYYEQFSHLESNLHFLNRYLKLIAIFKERNLNKNIGFENHHIFPRAFGGSNKENNLVYCSLKGHYILHHLLWKAFPKNKKMIYAFWMMSHSRKEKIKITSRVYEILKTEFCDKMKNDIWINNGIEQKKSSPEELENHLNLGWEIGRLPRSEKSKKKQSDSMTGKIKIIKDNLEKTINPELLQEFLDLGWILGSLPRPIESILKMKNTKRGMIWINNGIEQKQIKKEDLQYCLDLCWVCGRLPFTEEHKEKNRTEHLGRVHINDGVNGKLIKPDLLQGFLDLGWKLGPIFISDEAKLKISNSKKGRIWITNNIRSNIKNKMIKLEELQTFLDLGWERGRIFQS